MYGFLPRVLFLLLFFVVLGLVPTATIAANNPVPILYPIQPNADAPGSAAFTLTVTGTGFVSGSVVTWNGNTLTTTFVSGSKLTAAVPASYVANPTTATITVISPTPGGGISNSQYFQVAYSLSQLSWSSFSLSGQVPVTSRIVAGDFNNDGIVDLAVAMGSRAFILLGNGDGTYQSAIPSYGPSGTITGIYVADANADGKLDLIVTGSKSTTTSFVATMLGNGNGTLQSPIETDFTGSIPSTAVLADFNGDGALDLAYTNGMSVQTLLGNGSGGFATGPSSSLAQIGLGAVAVGDFNQDGKLDLVVTVYDAFSTGLDYPGVMTGNGDGSFNTLVPVNGTGAAFVGAITAVVGDFNGDGQLDIATGIQTVGATLQGIIQISLGNGDGTFAAPYTVPNVPEVTTPLLVADFNGDGYLDLATGGYIYYGEGNGTFPMSSGRSGLPTFVMAADVNGDGEVDLIDEAISFIGTTVYYQIGLEKQSPPQPDFKGIVAPFSSTLTPGGSISFNITIEPLYGFAGDVIVGVTGLPNGITPSYNPTVVKGGSGTTTITLTAASNVQIGSYTATLTGNSGAISHWTTVPFDINYSVGDWTGYVAQQAQNIAPGGTATYSLATTPINGFNGNIALNVSGLPPGAMATFTPATITGGSGTSTLSVVTDATTPQPQVYDLTITGTEGILVHSSTVYLGVSSSGGNFSGTVSPSIGSVSASGAGSATYNISLSPLNGGAGDVSFTANNLPAGVTAVFAPSTVSGGSGSSTLTLYASSGTPPGTYSIYITSTGSGVAHQTYVTLVVNP
jgi:FG-GAP-like repeat